MEIIKKWKYQQDLMIILKKRDVAQLGSAPLWGSGGRGFKSRRSDINPYYHYLLMIYII